MTPEEALELLNNMEFKEEYQGKDEYTDMLIVIKSALEKQIPKKPLPGIECHFEVICPNCVEHLIDRATKHVITADNI